MRANKSRTECNGDLGRRGRECGLPSISRLSRHGERGVGSRPKHVGTVAGASAVMTLRDKLPEKFSRAVVVVTPEGRGCIGTGSGRRTWFLLGRWLGAVGDLTSDLLTKSHFMPGHSCCWPYNGKGTKPLNHAPAQVSAYMERFMIDRRDGLIL